MNKELREKFTVITNHELDKKYDYEDKERLQDLEAKPVTTPKGYSTNPMYEKLMQFKENQKKKRFTVEDLLKW